MSEYIMAQIEILYCDVIEKIAWFLATELKDSKTITLQIEVIQDIFQSFDDLCKNYKTDIRQDIITLKEKLLHSIHKYKLLESNDENQYQYQEFLYDWIQLINDVKKQRYRNI